jgi:hypothetical protein
MLASNEAVSDQASHGLIILTHWCSSQQTQCDKDCIKAYKEIKVEKGMVIERTHFYISAVKMKESLNGDLRACFKTFKHICTLSCDEKTGGIVEFFPLSMSQRVLDKQCKESPS